MKHLLKTKFILLLFLLTTKLGSIHAQSETENIKVCLKQIEEINSIPLKKLFIGIKDLYGKEQTLFSDYRFRNDLMTNTVYMDSMNRIRKHIYLSYTDTKYRFIESYYNEKGSQIYLLYRNSFWDDTDQDSYDISITESGYVFTKKGEVIKQEHRLLKQFQNEYGVDEQEYFDSYKPYSKYFNIADYASTEKLLLYNNVHSYDQTFVSKAQIVKFDGKKGNSFINRNNVTIRTGAGKEYPQHPKINNVDIGTYVEIESTNNAWSKVRYPFWDMNGYVFNTYLEPIERVITEKSPN